MYEQICWWISFTEAVLFLAGLEMLSALEEVHRAGWIHRDVKPANFVELVNPGAVSSWRIIDFGIARRYLTEDGSLIPKRDAFGEFRGSTTYASLNAHMKQDLGELAQQPFASGSERCCVIHMSPCPRTEVFMKDLCG